MGGGERAGFGVPAGGAEASAFFSGLAEGFAEGFAEDFGVDFAEDFGVAEDFGFGLAEGVGLTEGFGLGFGLWFTSTTPAPRWSCPSHQTSTWYLPSSVDDLIFASPRRPSRPASSESATKTSDRADAERGSRSPRP